MQLQASQSTNLRSKRMPTLCKTFFQWIFYSRWQFFPLWEWKLMTFCVCTRNKSPTVVLLLFEAIRELISGFLLFLVLHTVWLTTFVCAWKMCFIFIRQPSQTASILFEFLCTLAGGVQKWCNRYFFFSSLPSSHSELFSPQTMISIEKIKICKMSKPTKFPKRFYDDCWTFPETNFFLRIRHRLGWKFVVISQSQSFFWQTLLGNKESHLTNSVSVRFLFSYFSICFPIFFLESTKAAAKKLFFYFVVLFFPRLLPSSIKSCIST